MITQRVVIQIIITQEHRCFTLIKSQLAETVNIIQFIYLKTNKQKNTVKLKMFSKNAYAL